MNIDKSEILALIVEQLDADLSVLEQAVAMAHDTATHADCLGSSKYETMGLEASYLAQGQGIRLLEIERSQIWFKALELAEPTAVVAMSSLVELVNDAAEHQVVWFAAQAGGLKVHYGEIEVTVITLKSPLGRILLGKVVGDEFEIDIAGKQRSYYVSAVH